MLLAEKYAMADIATMKARERNDGQSDLINAVLDLRSGMSQEEAVKKYGEETVRRALIIK